MRIPKLLCAALGLALSIACGGGAGSPAQPALSMALSTRTITASTTTADSQSATATFEVILAGKIPDGGLYYSCSATTNGIQSVQGGQAVVADVPTFRFTVYYKNGPSLALGSLQDSIIVTFALDQAGTKPIGNSPLVVFSTLTVSRMAPPLSLLSPASAWVGGPDFTLTVSGFGIQPDTQVAWNGIPMPTTFVSANTLNATIPAQMIAAAGTAQITVTGPNMGASQALAFPIGNSQSRIFDVHCTDIAWDRVNQVLYAGIMANSANYPLSIIAIDPATGLVKNSVSTPPDNLGFGGVACLAIDDACTWLYAAQWQFPASGAYMAVHRYQLPSLTLDPTYACAPGDPWHGVVYAPTFMRVAPGTSGTLAMTVMAGANPAGIAIYDNGTQRGPLLLANLDPQHYFQALEWSADGSTLFAADHLTPPGEFLAFAVTGSGASIRSDLPGALKVGGHDLHRFPGTGKLFLGNGQVLDGATGLGVGACGSGWSAMAVDPDLTMGFYLDPAFTPFPGGYGWVLHSYDLTRFSPLSSATIPTLGTASNMPFFPDRVVRCGPSALALCGQMGQLCIVTGPFAQGK